MNVVVGLGNVGCNIIKFLKDVSLQSSFFAINSSEFKESKIKFIKIPEFSNIEHYDSKVPKIKKHFDGLKGDLLLITSGIDEVSFSSLNILNQLKNKFNIYVLLVRPNFEMVSQDENFKERIIYNVFQEYAKSGLFKRLYLVSNASIERIFNGIPLLGYENKVYQTIVSTFYMITSFDKAKPVFNNSSQVSELPRIATFSMIDNKTEEEKMFFPLKNISDSVYYFGYQEKVLREDPNILGKVKDIIKTNSLIDEKRISYKIFVTEHDINLTYSIKFTNTIQD